MSTANALERPRRGGRSPFQPKGRQVEDQATEEVRALLGDVYLVDGLAVQDVIAGGLGTELPLSGVSQMSIKTGGFDAEYGNALSGVVNIVGEHATQHIALDAPLTSDIEGLSWPMSHWVETSTSSSEVPVSTISPTLTSTP